MRKQILNLPIDEAAVCGRNKDPLVANQVPWSPVFIASLRELVTKARLVQEAIKLEKKISESPHRWNSKVYGVSAGKLFQDTSGLSAAALNTFRTSYPQIAPVVETRAFLKNKIRNFYKFDVTDMLVSSLITTHLNELHANKWSPNLYSYQKGRSSLQALRAICGFLQLHHKTELYCFHTDIKSYTDSFDLNENSPFWKTFDSGFSFEQPEDRRYLKNLIRPVVNVRNRDHAVAAEFSKVMGLSTGSSLSCFFFNFFLSDLDAMIEDLTDESSRYFRYGDDLLFVSTSLAQARQAQSVITDVCDQKRLRLNADKTDIFCFNRNGFTAPEQTVVSRQYFNIFGHRLAKSGSKQIKPNHHRAFVRGLNALLENLQNGVKVLGLAPGSEERAVLAIEAVNAYLGDLNSWNHLPHLDHLIMRTDCRGFLKSADFFIAQRVSSFVSEVEGARSFRKFPMRELYRLGLISLVARRNAGVG